MDYLEDGLSSPLFSELNFGEDLCFDESLTGIDDILTENLEKDLKNMVNHPSNGMDEEDDSIERICFYCGCLFNTLAKLRHHLSTHSPPFANDEELNLETDTVEATTEAVSPASTGNRRPFSCPYCNYRASKVGNLRCHVRAMHTGEKPYACAFCNYRCVQSSQVKNHIKAKHMEESLLECSFCTYKCAQSGHLKRHIQAKHTGEKPFNCNYCSYKCVQSIHLQRHIKAKHTGEKPYECSFCNFRCVQSGFLKRHINSKHKGEKTISCSVCTYTCSKPEDLVKHAESEHPRIRDSD